MKKLLPYTCIILIIIQPAKTQSLYLFKDKAAEDSMQNAVTELYNYSFTEAENSVSSVRAKYGDHPAIEIFDCLMLYWKNFPVSTHPEFYKQYKEKLMATSDKCEQLLDEDGKSSERIFYCLLTDILIARFYYEDGESRKAFSYTYKAYKLIKKGFTLQKDLSEFYFTTGLYRYYREFIPDQHPLYKGFIWLFPGGDKMQGLQYLDKASKEALFVKAEALMFASLINLRYENNLPNGLMYAENLNTLYPNNLFFKTLYVENLIQSGQYVKAREELSRIEESKIDFYKLPCYVFEGMLAERYTKNLSEAEKYYKDAVNTVKKVTKATQNYVGLAYFGLGNINKVRNNKELSSGYYKKCCDYCEYVSIKKISCN